MKYSRIKFPWQQLERGQGFFLPCLNYAEAREYVLKQAVQARIFYLKASPGIMDGFAGIWFFR